MSAQVYQDSLGVQYYSHTEGDTTYLMRQYFMCFLIEGDRRDQDEAEIMAIQQGHMAHLDSLANAGLISIAGPFGGDQPKLGIAIYNTATLEEAQKYAAMDPAVKAGRLKVEILPWWSAVGSVLK